MPEPYLDDIQTNLQVPATLRLALDSLQGEMPVEWETDSVRQVLYSLRGKLDELELEEIRRLGPQDYLMIKPPCPRRRRGVHGEGGRARQGTR